VFERGTGFARLSGPLRHRQRPFALAVAGALVLLASQGTPVTASHGWRSATPYHVIVHSDNPLRELSRDQIAAYFLKRRTTWPNGAPVDPVDLPPDSRARFDFSREVLRRSPNDVSAYWIQEIFAGRTEPPEVKGSDAAVVAYVSSAPGAIGYVSAMPNNSFVRVLVLIP